MTAWIVDTSVWHKAGRVPTIARRLRDLATHHVILTCPPQVLEYCHSARDAAEHREHCADMASFLQAERHPDAEAVLGIQARLWGAGLVRGAGRVDVLVAAYAIANDAVVLTSDRDHDHIAAVEPSFRHEYLAEH